MNRRIHPSLYLTTFATILAVGCNSPEQGEPQLEPWNPSLRFIIDGSEYEVHDCDNDGIIDAVSRRLVNEMPSTRIDTAFVSRWIDCRIDSIVTYPLDMDLQRATTKLLRNQSNFIYQWRHNVWENEQNPNRH